VERLTATAPAIMVESATDLVRRAAGGDTPAFERLLVERADRAFRIARAIMGNDSDARDATQVAFVSAWRQLPRLRDPETFDAWLRRILVNACRAELRGRRRVREISLEGARLDRPATETPFPDRLGDTDLLARAFERLDADKRAILVLHHLDHQPVAALADALGIPVGTAKWRLSEARAALQRALIAEGERLP
jgi:RNA polymerase sigma-70 factor (ECF subfamily)